MRARRERRRTSRKQRKVTVTESRWTNEVGKREREREREEVMEVMITVRTVKIVYVLHDCECSVM